MALTNDEIVSLEWIRDYLEAAGAPDSIPMPEEVAHRLSKHYANFGYTSQIKLLDDLHDAPVLTLIKIILALDS